MATAKLSEFVLMAILSVLIPSGQKETRCQIFQNERPGKVIILVRTDKGFDIFKEFDGKRESAGKIVTTDQPGVFDITKPDEEPDHVDVRDFVKALKPLDANPSQAIVFQGVTFGVSSSAKTSHVELEFDQRGDKIRFEIKPVGATSQPTSEPTSAPAPR